MIASVKVVPAAVRGNPRRCSSTCRTTPICWSSAPAATAVSPASSARATHEAMKRCCSDCTTGTVLTSWYHRRSSPAAAAAPRCSRSNARNARSSSTSTQSSRSSNFRQSSACGPSPGRARLLRSGLRVRRGRSPWRARSANIGPAPVDSRRSSGIRRITITGSLSCGHPGLENGPRPRHTSGTSRRLTRSRRHPSTRADTSLKSRKVWSTASPVIDSSCACRCHQHRTPAVAGSVQRPNQAGRAVSSRSPVWPNVTLDPARQGG